MFQTSSLIAEFFEGVQTTRIYVCSETGKKINLIESTLSISTVPTFLFHSTPVMNYFTWNTLVSAYPLLTTQSTGIVNTYHPDHSPKLKACVEKYEKHGFTFVSDPAPGHECGVHPYCPRTIRWVGDSATMRIHFHKDGDEEPMDLIDPLMTWRLSAPRRCDQPNYPVYGYVEVGTGHVLGTISLLVSLRRCR
jgi:hypothetical protein